MNAQEIFRSRKNDVVRLWTEAVYSTYPFETTGFLRTKQDAFGNPVANMTKEAAGTLYDAVAGEEVEVATVKNALERFVKLRAEPGPGGFLPDEAPSAGAHFARAGRTGGA